VDDTRLHELESAFKQMAARQHRARETERALIARELHDELGQTLTGLKLEMALMVRELLPTGLGPGMIDRLQSLMGGIEVATEAVRRMATALRPPALDHLGLEAAIELEASALTRRTGIRCRLTGQLAPTALGGDAAIAVFRIVQEALTNVARHANASAVTIRMRETARTVRVIVADNGRGIPAEALAAPDSIGLIGMRERAELIGATLSITSRSGKGTSIVLTIPIARSA
jgi:signal transduction histidine kinase